MTRVLFLDSKHAARSRMAEAMARSRGMPEVEFFSAGLSAGPMHPGVVPVLREIGVSCEPGTDRSPADCSLLGVDILVTLSREAEEQVSFLTGHPVRLAWHVPDPTDESKGGDESTRFRAVRDMLARLLDGMVQDGYLHALAFAKHDESLILENISDGIVAHDLQRRIFYFNAAAEAITGYRREEVLNHDCHDVFPGRFCGGQCMFCEGPPSVNFDAIHKELIITTKSGDERTIQMTIKTMADTQNRTSGVLVSFHDVTRERELARRVGEVQHFAGIVGRDKKMQEVFDLIRELADTSVPVLIEGESGTGKELVAAAIHNEGPRANRQFVPVNCGALPESLLESELFGHVKGAFTGAIRDKKGRFELADGGTIFLDEIGDITPATQVKLLRVLQEGTFERVGGEQTMRADVRVISATNKDLQEEIEAGRFREDLFYRLNVVPVHLPSLRERRNDIPLLAEHCLARILKENSKEGITLSPEALDIMMSYDWPGNVRELQNWLQFAIVKCRSGMIRPEHLPPVARVQPGFPAESIRRRKLSIEMVRAAIEQAHGNKVEAARLLNVSRATLYRFLEASGLAG